MSFENDIDYLKRVTLELTGEAFAGSLSVRSYVDNLISYFTNILACLPNNVYWLDRNCNLLGGNDNLAHHFHLNSAADLKGFTYEQMAKAIPLPIETLEPFRIAEKEIMRTGLPIIDKEELPIKLKDKTCYYLSN